MPQRTWRRWNKGFLFYWCRIFNCLLHGSLTRKYENENVKLYSRNLFYFLHCSYFQKQMFSGVLYQTCFRLDLVLSKYTGNKEKHNSLTLSWQRFLSYINQSIDMLCKLMNCFLYSGDLFPHYYDTSHNLMILTE